MSKKLIYLVSFVLVVGLVTSASADLVGHWRLDESDGDTANDSSGNGNQGILQGDPQWVAGMIGGALDFDGEAYVDCGNDASLNVTGPFSATIWINPGTLGGPDSVAPLCKADSGAGWSWQLRFAWGAGGQDDIIGWQFNSPGERTWVYVGQVLPVGEWYHIAVSHDGETVKLYLDGEETDSAEMTGFAGSTAPFLIGSEGWGFHWIGGIDDVRLYDHGLSPPEILGIMVGKILPNAWGPTPADGAMDQDTWANLSWNPGPFAVSHDVYLGDNFDDVNDGAAETFQGNQATTSLTIGFPGFAYPDGLIRGTTYYWRIDEVNDTEPNSPWKGDVWSFTIANYLVVDDFEAYNDLNPGDPESNRIFNVWLDGYDDPTNGALIGNDTPPFAEQSIVHRGAQSMPYFYDNSGTANYSEAERTFSPAQDWTRESVKVLSLWFKGYPAYMGSFVEGPTGTFTMTAEGVDIWDNSDQFHFAYKELSGAGTIIAKVENVENTHEWAKAGVMIRDTLEPDSRHAMVAISPGNGVWFGRRETAGGSSSSDNEAGITAPQWVKIERTVGGLIKAYYSADGTTWTQLGMPESVTMNMPMYVGLALTSHNSGVACEAKFSNITSEGTGQWIDEDIGLLSNEAEPVYVTAKDSSGTAATVYHDDPDASLINTWTEWKIDLKEFGDAGVVLTDVSNLAIGFGGADDPQPGGSGLVFFDDVRLYVPRPVDPGDNALVAYYAFENDANDSSGNGLHGIVVGDPTYVEGLAGYGMAMDFDGTDDLVELGKFDVVGGITLAVWIKADDFEINDARIISKAKEWGGDDHWWMLSTISETSLRFRLKTDEGPGTATLISDPVLEAGLWTHVVAAWDGSMMRIYKDGVEVASQEKGGSAVAVDPAIGVAIGSQPSDAFASDPSHVAKFFDGLLDEVRIYNRALSDLEVRYLAGDR